MSADGMRARKWIDTESLVAMDSVALDPFREAFGAVAAPVSIVTALGDDGRPHGTTVSSFCSLSASPPLIVVALDLSSNLLELVASTHRFGVNVLAHGQEEIALACASKREDKFDSVPWREADGLPRVDGTAVWFACDLVRLVDGGDHEIAIGLIGHCETAEVAPLVYHRRSFATLSGPA